MAKHQINWQIHRKGYDVEALKHPSCATLNTGSQKTSTAQQIMTVS